jgi:hypothetical protein
MNLLCHTGGTTFRYHGFAMNEETKHCARCQLDVPVASFNKRKNGCCYAYCRPCQTEYLHEHYLRNASLYKKRRRESGRRYLSRDKNYVAEYLRSHPCVDCGEHDPLVLEFDHVDPESKEATIASLVRWGCALDRLQREIAKCEVRCVHCHRRRTAKQFRWRIAS